MANYMVKRALQQTLCIHVSGTEMFNKAETIAYGFCAGSACMSSSWTFCKAWYTHIMKTGSPKGVNKDCLHPKRKGCSSPGARKSQLLLVSKDFLQHLKKKKCSYTKKHWEKLTVLQSPQCWGWGNWSILTQHYNSLHQVLLEEVRI